MSPRTVVGDCTATYSPERDITIFALEIPNVGVFGAVAPGDGWEVDCRPNGDRFLAAQQSATGRFATITVDRGHQGPPDVQTYAAESAAHLRNPPAELGLTNVRVAPPEIVADGVYVLAMQGQAPQGPFAQLNVHHLLPSPIGLLRYHLSETAENGRVLNEHANLLVMSASVFAQAPQ